MFVIFIIVRVLNIFDFIILLSVKLCLFFFIVISDDVSLGNEVLMVMIVSLIIVLFILKKLVIFIVFYINICEFVISKSNFVIS